MLFKDTFGAQNLSCAYVAASSLQISGLSGALLQFGFVVEEIHLRWASIHEEEDTRLCVFGQVSYTREHGVGACGGRSRFGGEEAILVQQPGESEAGEPGTHLP